MPEISRFFGIVITMYYKDHAPPHFHARYGGEEAQFAIATGERLAGRLPPRVQGLVSEWLEMHREALHGNWTRAREGRSLDRIDGLV